MAQASGEKTYVEIPFIEQLKEMGWEHIECVYRWVKKGEKGLEALCCVPP
jgi:hypothetical protein